MVSRKEAADLVNGHEKSIKMWLTVEREDQFFRTNKDSKS